MNSVQLFLNVFFALFSAIAGVIIGNWYVRTEAEITLTNEKRRLRKELVKAFRFNIDRLNQMKGQLTGPSCEIPDYALETQSVAHILFHGRKLFNNEEWFEKFNWYRYQFLHIDMKVQFLNDVVNLGTPATTFLKRSNPITVNEYRYHSLVKRLPELIIEIENLLLRFQEAEST